MADGWEFRAGRSRIRGEPAAVAPVPSVRLALDVEAERTAIRRSLTFEFRPLEGKGRRKIVGLAEWGGKPFRPIVEEILLAYSEISTNFATDHVVGDMYRLGNFFRFLDDAKSPQAAKHAPTTLKEIGFATQRDFEHWLGERPSRIRRSLEDDRREALIAFVAAHPLPRHRGGVQPIVSLTALCAAIGAPPSYIAKYPALWEVVAQAAARQKMHMPKSRRVGAAPPRGRSSQRGATGAEERLARRTVEEIYYTLSKVLRHIQRRRRHLLADDFVLAPPKEAGSARMRAIKSAALSPSEFEALDRACLAAIRRVKTRLLSEGPSRAARGRSDPYPGENDAAWGSDLDNMVAYLHKYAPCQVVGRGGQYPKHRRFVNALISRGRETGHQIAQWLSPAYLDLFPFLVRMACSEYAPLNLASLLDLHVDPDDPQRHCVRPSPTAGHKRIYYSKPRAGIDQDHIDVPARGAFDQPGLIETVIELTRDLRAHAPPALRHRLWLYLSEMRGIRELTELAATAGLRKFVAREDIRVGGELLQGLHFRRFRPTVIGATALDNGLETAQKRAAHAHPPQTLAYVNNPGNQQRVSAAVLTAQSKAIAAVRSGFSQRPRPHEVTALAQELGVSRGAAAELIAGKRDKLFNGCVDDCNGRGPEPAGRRCGRFESCLVCVNSVILERHLPRLITHYRHWLAMADEMEPAAWSDAHELNCAIVENHLQKFDPALVARITADVSAGPELIGYRRFKQS
jgi:hypothetical protein